MEYLEKSAKMSMEDEEKKEEIDGKYRRVEKYNSDFGKKVRNFVIFEVFL